MLCEWIEEASSEDSDMEVDETTVVEEIDSWDWLVLFIIFYIAFTLLLKLFFWIDLLAFYSFIICIYY